MSLSRSMATVLRGAGVLLVGLFLGVSTASADRAAAVGSVYVMTNSPSGNEVITFARYQDGSLAELSRVSTGGMGIGTGLGSQGAVMLSKERFLFVVNPGSDSLSVFRVRPRGLVLTDVQPSGGIRPISVTVNEEERLVYVLNAGSPIGLAPVTGPSIFGFWLSEQGKLQPIEGSSRLLSSPMADPAQIGFTPHGTVLVVTEKATDTIATFAVDEETGLATEARPQPSAGNTPFGFTFDKRGNLLVTEAFQGLAASSAVSMYAIEDDDDSRGLIQVRAASVPNKQTGACWIALTKNGRYAYVTNAGSDTISGYRIGSRSTLSLLDSDGVTAHTGESPVDLALNHNSRFLYALEAGSDSISAYRVNSNGSLDLMQEVKDLPDGAAGIAAR